MRQTVKGRGVVNWLIENSPFELHLPYSFSKTYSYCGPGTKLLKRLAENSKPVNKLDELCKSHDIFYHNNKDTSERHKADLKLAAGAEERIKSKDSSVGEKASACIVNKAMKAKVKLGMGIKTKARKIKKKSKRVKIIPSKVFGAGIKAAKHAVKSSNNKNANVLSKYALNAARRVFKKVPKFTLKPRVIKVPKSGGFLPFLIPIFAALSAAGALAGGAANIVSAVDKVKQGKKISLSHKDITQPWKKSR